MKKLSKVICLVLSALMLLSLAACGKQGDGTGDTQGKPIEGGTFVYAIEEPITSLNWYNNSSTDLLISVTSVTTCSDMSFDCLIKFCNCRFFYKANCFCNVVLSSSVNVLSSLYIFLSSFH